MRYNVHSCSLTTSLRARLPVVAVAVAAVVVPRIRDDSFLVVVELVLVVETLLLSTVVAVTLPRRSRIAVNARDMVAVLVVMVVMMMMIMMLREIL